MSISRLLIICSKTKNSRNLLTLQPLRLVYPFNWSVLVFKKLNRKFNEARFCAIAALLTTTKLLKLLKGWRSLSLSFPKITRVDRKVLKVLEAIRRSLSVRVAISPKQLPYPSCWPWILGNNFKKFCRLRTNITSVRSTIISAGSAARSNGAQTTTVHIHG